MPSCFQGFDLDSFWEDCDDKGASYGGQPPTDQLIEEVEADLGYKLPQSYIELMWTQNGGYPVNDCFPTKKRTSWAKDHVAITGIFGIGKDAPDSLCGEGGSRFWIDMWGYPDYGIYVCDCPSAGHDMILLDYRRCGKSGEPRVVHVDQERHYRITFLAKNFEMFIRGLVHESVYDTSDEDLAKDYQVIARGRFSTLLSGLVEQSEDPAFYERAIRGLCRKKTASQGYFALHGDEISHLVYDVVFLLYTTSHALNGPEAFLDPYRDLIASGDGTFTTAGFSPSFITEYVEARTASGILLETGDRGLKFREYYRAELKRKITSILEEPPA